jgi:hypothetical protein
MAVCCLALCSPLAHAKALVFETEAATLTISDTGSVQSLIDKSTHDQWLHPGTPPSQTAFALVRSRGRVMTATEIALHGDLYTIRFGRSGIEADYRISPRKSYLLIELVALRGGPVDQITFAQLPVKPATHASGLLNVKWDDHFTVCLMGLDDQVQAGFGPGGSLRTTASREFPLIGRKAALIAVPTTGFDQVVQQVERDFKIPHARIAGKWGKLSDAVRGSYLFIDLTEKNADEIIRLAKLGGFKAILIYSGTWSKSNGSYPINTTNYPLGEQSLKAVVDKCHAAGLMVGIHMLTSFVGKNDPLVRPKPDPRLLKDASAVLAQDVDVKADSLVASAALKGFPVEPSYYGERGGMDVQIDDEIIRYQSIGGSDSTTLLHCTRGINGTHAAAHQSGAKIQHLAQRYDSYLVDLHTSLKDQLAQRIAGVINRCGLDMIYFDGGEVNSANGPGWYWVGVQQSGVFSRVKRDLLVQGSGRTHWTWHFYSRGTCDDFAAIAPKEFLDYHKIADSWQSYHNQFLPAELGWWGFLSETPDHPATTSDEVEFYTTRMLALDSAVSLETTLSALRKVGQSESLLGLLGEHEALRLSETVPKSVREKLETGEWHWSHDAQGRWQFQPVRYDPQGASTPTAIPLQNQFGAQPLRFRLQVGSRLAPIGDPANITLLKPAKPIEISLPASNAPMPGALAFRTSFAEAAGDQSSALMVGGSAPAAGKLKGKYRDLSSHRAMAIRIEVDARPPTRPASSQTAALPAVLNVQIESEGKRYRDHYIDLDFTGSRTIILPGPNPQRMLQEFRPAGANYSFKLAGYTFNYQRIVALNLRWMRRPPGESRIKCKVSLVEALAESDAVLQDPKLSLNDQTLSIPATLHTGDYAEFWAADAIRILDANGMLKQTIKPSAPLPMLHPGLNQLQVDASSHVPIKFTLITLGEPIPQSP